MDIIPVGHEIREEDHYVAAPVEPERLVTNSADQVLEKVKLVHTTPLSDYCRFGTILLIATSRVIVRSVVALEDWFKIWHCLFVAKFVLGLEGGRCLDF